MAKKMPRRLVALSGSAIAAIYFAGFAATAAADAGIAAQTPTSSTAATASALAPVNTAAAAPTSATSSAPTVSPYKDGTFTGTGTSRRGSISVAVTVSGGRISNVNITKVATEYPISAVSSLPSQVVAKQSANVNGVSGATYSAQAFRGAVQAALQQASA